MNNVSNYNTLINEKSPYLLQHANNPVDWYPWGEEAFKKAQIEDKPIFLSIGYSTCHWCHVMAHESFENEAIAKYLNENYVSIKVDREERPDVDSVYMSVCQALTGSGGWPLSVFIDYNKKPIYAGTYFPKNAFYNLLENINDLWKNDRKNLMNHSEAIIRHISNNKNEIGETDISIADETFHLLETNFDEKYGGFSAAPKFPSPHNLLFLMNYYLCTENPKALEMCISTLDHMRSGGIYDHIGYGFSRYSTDRKWLVPHFEKMLYDNVLLMIVYSECYRLHRDEKYLETAIQISEYLLRKMKNKEGGFFTAEDADSEGEEGLFYVFTKQELKNILDIDELEVFCNYFDITDKGNFEGKNIPNLIGKYIKDEDKNRIEEIRRKIFKYQDKRIHPHIDDKILTSYNGLAIAAFAFLGRITQNNVYINIAKEVAEFLNEKMFINGKLMARYRDKDVKYLGYDEDYAYFIMGLIELYQTTFENKYLDFAVDLNNIFIEHFYDFNNGGFYQSDKDSEVILVRKKEIYDGATPSANAIAVNNLYRLASLTQNDTLVEYAEKTLQYFANEIKEYPAAYTFSAINILLQSYGSTDIIVTAHNRNEINDMIKIIHDCDVPFTNILFINNDDDYKVIENKPTAYICKGFMCLPPIIELENLCEVLRK